MNKKNTAVLVGVALSGLTFFGACSSATAKTGAQAEGECHGINSCKGTGECGGKGHSCAGKNSCKGQGWLKMSKQDCDAKKGTFKADEKFGKRKQRKIKKK